ncbi:tRNA (adenine(22)-N(1))-methyltransferase [Paenibacillus thailandensis]|uniref:tRNA (Adenine(22)-N(1))-methyltransferase n=1 Tax=Paenibacillus thailandensis TaxID=393250 RepID=A0ABW5QZB9_9BACL
MLKLSNRLQAIAEFVTPGNRVADIGSDHALLPAFLVQSGKAPSAIAGELNQGPLLAARKQVAAAGLAQRIDVRQGDGLSVIGPNETDTVTIAGMGGALMRDILEAGYRDGKLEGVKELVLQPNIGEELVREWLLRREFALLAERILEEDGKIYEILHAAKNGGSHPDGRKLYDREWLGAQVAEPLLSSVVMKMGPYLLRSPNEVFFKKWNSELKKMNRIAEQLSQSELPEAGKKLAALKSEIAAIEEVLRCLQTDKR